MTNHILVGSLLKNKQNMACKFSQWPLVVAFISGILLTAAAAQMWGLTGIQEPLTPAPQNAPGLLEPDYSPDYSPADYGITEVA